MGWWSKDILGGDTPLDMIWSFEKQFNTESLYPLENWSGYTRTKVKQSIENDKKGFWKAVKHAEEMAGYEGTQIALQVAAVLWLNSGAKMDGLHMGAFIKAAQEDKWAKEDEERKAVMDNLIENIKNYYEAQQKGMTDVFITVSSEGLLEKIDKHICKGHTPKEAIKDLLFGINKDAQKRIFKELLAELEEKT